MARHKTGGAICRWVKKDKKTIKIWYACIPDDGQREQIVRKPAYNSETSAREKAREPLAEFDTNRKAFDVPSMTFEDLADFYKDTLYSSARYLAPIPMKNDVIEYRWREDTYTRCVFLAVSSNGTA